MDTEIFKDGARYRVQVKSWCLADEIIIFHLFYRLSH